MAIPIVMMLGSSARRQRPAPPFPGRQPDGSASERVQSRPVAIKAKNGAGGGAGAPGAIKPSADVRTNCTARSRNRHKGVVCFETSVALETQLQAPIPIHVGIWIAPLVPDHHSLLGLTRVRLGPQAAQGCAALNRAVG